MYRMNTWDHPHSLINNGTLAVNGVWGRLGLCVRVWDERRFVSQYFDEKKLRFSKIMTSDAYEQRGSTVRIIKNPKSHVILVVGISLHRILPFP